jgi:hypothetical protein
MLDQGYGNHCKILFCSAILRSSWSCVMMTTLAAALTGVERALLRADDASCYE